MGDRLNGGVDGQRPDFNRLQPVASSSRDMGLSQVATIQMHDNIIMILNDTKFENRLIETVQNSLASNIDII